MNERAPYRQTESYFDFCIDDPNNNRYIIVIGITFLYWKIFRKKALAEMGVTKRFGNYFVGIAAGLLLAGISVLAVMLTGTIKYHGIFRSINFAVILLMFGGFVVQGATEEILCRGLALWLNPNCPSR